MTTGGGAWRGASGRGDSLGTFAGAGSGAGADSLAADVGAVAGGGFFPRFG
jgi:hypothetical protein